MALDARVLDVGVPIPVMVVASALDLEHSGPKLFRSEALLVGQIADDFDRVGLIQPSAVQSHHPSDRRLPTLGRFPQPGDSGHPPAIVDLVAAGAAVDHRLIGDRKAVVQQHSVGVSSRLRSRTRGEQDARYGKACDRDRETSGRRHRLLAGSGGNDIGQIGGLCRLTPVSWRSRGSDHGAASACSSTPAANAVESAVR